MRRWAGTLNCPQARLAGGRFVTFESADQFGQISKRRAARLRDEGWHHTGIRSMDVMHTGPNKVHIALAVDGRREDGGAYNRLDTLWIATLIDGHRRIQLRSGHLR